MKARKGSGQTWMAVAAAVAAALAGAAGARVAAQEASPTLPRHRVVAYYFHRTVRCPSCQRIGDLTEETFRNGLAPQVRRGEVQMYYINLEDPANAPYVRHYRITGPTLVLIDVQDERILRWKPLEDVWLHFREKEALARYVTSEVRQYLETTP